MQFNLWEIEQKANRWYWNDLAELHTKKCKGLTLKVMNGRSTLRHLETSALPDLKNKKVLHLMCHLGFDTISLARHGASVTAIDISESAIAFASKLTDRCRLNVKFINCSVLELPKSLESNFDVIIMTYGVLEWIPDLLNWAKACSKLLNTNGQLLVIDDHPASSSLAQNQKKVNSIKTRGSYLDRKAEGICPIHFRWFHGTEGLSTALKLANFDIVHMSEYHFTHYKRDETYVLKDDGYYYSVTKKEQPLLLKVSAKKQ